MDFRIPQAFTSWAWASAHHAVPSTVVSTMHGAKGQEFDLVFLPGWDEGIFPLRSKGEPEPTISSQKL